MQAASSTQRIRFGAFELDTGAGELRRQGVVVRLPPQPFKLLALLASRPGQLVTRDEIRRELWGDGTFVDFDQGMNFSVKQVREALGDNAEQPRYVETVPKRGYRFVAPVEPAGTQTARAREKPLTDVSLHKALWANIAEIRLAEQRRRRLLLILAAVVLAAGLILAAAKAL